MALGPGQILRLQPRDVMLGGAIYSSYRLKLNSFLKKKVEVEQLVGVPEEMLHRELIQKGYGSDAFYILYNECRFHFFRNESATSLKLFRASDRWLDGCGRPASLVNSTWCRHWPHTLSLKKVKTDFKIYYKYIVK
jgi:hypothetical protein